MPARDPGRILAWMPEISRPLPAVAVLRASDEDRERVVAELREHFEAGRLTAEEFSDRVGAVYAARTLGELGDTTADLPTLGQARRQVLEREVRRYVLHGWRVESQSEYSAVLVEGRRPNHAVHGLLTLFTVFWGFVWLAVALTGGERRVLLEVDDLGRVYAQGAPAS